MAYSEAARRLGCKEAAVRAVAEVESAGSGFLPDGRPKILFEAHIFSRLTAHKYDRSNRRISSRKRDKTLYQGGAREHLRLAEAAALDATAAYQSASWGRFQIMGFNWKRCGFPDLQGFLFAMRDDAGQLAAFVGFVIASGLADELQREDWVGFASVYNGPAFREYQYDTKIAAAYRRWQKRLVE